MHYRPYAHRLRELGFTDRIRKVTVNGGFTCPNLDGSKWRGGCTFCDNRSFSPVAFSRGQSIHDQIERGMDLCVGRGFDLCVHVILGLPGESREQWNLTALALNRWKYEGIKIHPLHVVKGTVLEDQHRRGEFQTLGLEEYVLGLVDFLERIPADVGIQRFTGDALGDLLVAPAWCRDKNAVLNAMHSEFERRGTWQGFHWKRQEKLAAPP